jgi:hypothetical protein
MLRKLIIAGAALAAFTAPTLAASNWNLLRPSTGIATHNMSSPCFVANRGATPGEQKVAGPFASQSAGYDSQMKSPACAIQNDK